MAYDTGLADLMRDDLADIFDAEQISEMKMFGGLAFTLNGHMVCGVHNGGAMFRVGKDREDAAMAIEGAGAMMFTGRKMGGMVDVTHEAMADDARRAAWLEMALDNARSLPPKTAKPRKPRAPK